MNTLYIIGNGFDIAHELPTMYWDFRLFLEQCDWQFLVKLEELFGITQIDIADPRNNVKAWESEIKNILWGSLEENLAYPDVEAMRSLSSSIVSQLDLDGGNWGIEDTMNSYWESMYGFVKDLSSYVEQWVKSIDLSGVIPRKRDWIGLEKGKILSFNYTSTLEECYHIDPDMIEHVHGGIAPYVDDPPIIGHGDKQAILTHQRKAKKADNLYDEGGKSIENTIANYYKNTLKDVQNIIWLKSSFFDNLKNIDHVVVVGLSYSSVDFSYLEAVKKRIKPEAFWTMCYYTPEDANRLNDTINKLNLDSTRRNCIHTEEYFKT